MWVYVLDFAIIRGAMAPLAPPVPAPLVGAYYKTIKTSNASFELRTNLTIIMSHSNRVLYFTKGRIKVSEKKL